MSSLFRLIGLALILAAAAFLVHTGAENPGSFHFVGFGWDVTMSATFATLLFAIALIFTYFFGQTINYLITLPQRLKNQRTLKKSTGGLDLLHQGFLALAAGDAKTAEKRAAQAAKKLPNTQLADLLSAEATQNEDALIALTTNPASALTGHLGLMTRAQDTQQWGQVAHHAQKILSLHKNAPKAQAALLEAALRQHNWAQAKSYTKNTAEQAALTLLTALEERDTNPQEAQALATQGLKKHPTFIPLVMFQAGLLSAQTKHKAAETLLTKSFIAIPRLDTFSRLLDTLLITTPDNKKRSKKAQSILKKLPQAHTHIKHLCAADAALDAGNTTAARKALSLALNFGETRETCQRFSTLEKQENNLQGSADWLQKALTAAPLQQPEDATIHFWQSFKDEYTAQPTLTNTLTATPQNLPSLTH